MRQGCADVRDDRRNLVESDCPADISGAGNKDLTLLKLADAAYVIDHADGSGDDACSARKALDVRVVRRCGRAAADIVIVSSIRICHPFLRIESADDEAREARIIKVSGEGLLARGDI